MHKNILLELAVCSNPVFLPSFLMPHDVYNILARNKSGGFTWDVLKYLGKHDFLNEPPPKLKTA